MANTRGSLWLMFKLALLAPFFFAANVGAKCTPKSGSFFGLPHWWEYLPTKIDDLGQCSPVFNFPGDIWAVGLAVTDMLLRVAGIVAVISIVIAGISYITAAGSADKITSARRRIVNSLIGLAIVVIASAAVQFIGKSLG
jgi:hypothetical protein